MREFSGEDCQVIMLGRPAAVTEIKYSAKQEKNNKYVLGRSNPYSMSKKRKEFEGEMTVPQSEFEALQSNLPEGSDVLDIAPFTVTVLYLNPETGFAVKDELREVGIMEWEKSMKTDAEGMDITLKLRIGAVVLNVQ